MHVRTLTVLVAAAAVSGACRYVPAVLDDPGCAQPGLRPTGQSTCRCAAESLAWDPGWLDPRWSSRRSVAVAVPDLAGGVSDFPLLVSLPGAGLGAKEAQPDACDVVFVDPEGGRVLAHEIESFNPTTGGLKAWVRVPQIDADQPLSLMLYYGSDHAYVGDGAGPKDVWDEHFVGVWHLADELGPAAVIADSTAAANGGIAEGLSSRDAAVGIAGPAIRFDGVGSGILLAAGSEIRLAGAFTAEGWFRADVISNAVLFGRMGGLGQRGWDLSFDDDAAIAPDGEAMFRASPDGQATAYAYAGVVSAGSWHHLVGVFTPGAAPQVYLDGAFVGAAPTVVAQVHMPQADTTIGRKSPSTEFFDGVLDEVRLSRVARSPAWIAATHATISNATTFLSVGQIEAQ